MHNARKAAPAAQGKTTEQAAAPAAATLRMGVHIAPDFNPCAEIIALADRCRDLARAAEALDLSGCPTGKRPRPIEPSQVRDLNFALCFLALRLSACRISIPSETEAAK
jgi:hypothetical protein